MFSDNRRRLVRCAGAKPSGSIRDGTCARPGPSSSGASSPGHDAATSTGAVPRPAVPAQPGQQQQQQEQLRIVADPATNSLIVYGTVQEYQNVKNILKELDAIPRQVLIEAMILQIDLRDAEDFGVDYELFRKSRQTIFGQTFGSNRGNQNIRNAFPGFTRILRRGWAQRHCR